MTTTVKNAIPAKFAEDADTPQYTAINCKAIIDKFTATNNSGGNESLAINLVANGGAAGSDNLIATKTIAPGKTYTFPEVVGQSLEAGDFISTIASAASSITIMSSVREIT